VTGAQGGAKEAVLGFGCWTSGRAGHSFAHEILASSGEANYLFETERLACNMSFPLLDSKAEGVEETVSLLAIQPNNKGLP
jgi:hypothetical protein